RTRSKGNILNLLLIFTSLSGYLEWGGGNHVLLFQAEADVLKKLWTEPMSVVHPFTLLPLVGQLILLYTLFQAQPGKRLTMTGLGALALLLVFMFVVGVISLNFKIILSTLPFMTVAGLTVRHYRKRQQ
ncbi:MAG: hypothetical protein IT269_04435, partial [Saprospiraceae bacterium]|nr:hypothetical protein [Saprospiraceae bacterium]